MSQMRFKLMGILVVFAILEARCNSVKDKPLLEKDPLRRKESAPIETTSFLLDLTKI